MPTHRSFRTLPVLAASVASLLVATPGAAHEGPHGAAPAPASADAPDPFSPEALDRALGEGWHRSADVAYYGRGDADGYHVYSAKEAEGFAPRTLATIRPDGYAEAEWTGYQCTSGTGRYVVAVVAPRNAVNRHVHRDRGALSYVVDTADGRVRPLVAGVGLKYHSPGCGTGDRAALTRNLGTDQRVTEVLLADLAQARVVRQQRVAAQLTSAVPLGNDVAGVVGARVVRLAARETVPRPLARVDGQPFELRPASDGGLDLLTVDTSKRTTVWHVRGNAARRLGTGPRGRVTLGNGRAGRTVVVGARRLGAAGDRVWLPAAGGLTADGASLDGHVVVGAPRRTGNATADRTHPAFATGAGTVLDRDLPEEAARPATALPRGLAALRDASTSTTSRSSASAVTASNTTTPVCAVPRNHPQRQVPQPDRKQLDWAVQMAVRGKLVGAAYTRPANYLNMGLAAYAPQTDFSKRTLSGWSTTNVPPSVMQGIMAQESAWRHASPKALPGLAGNPYISDYYGAAGTVDTINYDESDCGYGAAQVTTNMRTSDTGYTANGKTKVAVDYAENIAAGLQILSDKWNQLWTANIKANNADPQYLENWYFAIWAYNTGVQPNAANGNTTGCTPGPACTNANGNWGLGWTNNPRNADYVPDRELFLRESYEDAAHPGDWPYQEKVLGWMETPILNYKGESSYARPLYGQYSPPTQTGTPGLNVPGVNAFCDASNDCDPDHLAGDLSYCTLSGRDCWWNLPKTWASCPNECAISQFTYSDTAAEPTVTNPYPPNCVVSDNELPTSSVGPPVIVDDIGTTTYNVVGCYASGAAAKNWSQGGTFTYTYGTNASGTEVGQIDTHQLGSGWGGRTLFTKGRSATTPHLVNTGVWTPTLTVARNYNVKAHIPESGASASDATYTITSGATTNTVTIDQHLHEDRWVSLGNFFLSPGAKVTLTNKSSQRPGVFNVAFDAMAFTPLATGTVVTQTLDAIGPIDPNQKLDTAGAFYPNAKPMNSMANIRDWGETGLVRGHNSQFGTCTNPASPPNICTKANVKAWADDLWAKVLRAGSTTKPHYAAAMVTQADWLGLSNRRPPPTITEAFLADRHNYKIHHRLQVSYVKTATGAIEPASLTVRSIAQAGDSALPPFVTGFMRALELDHGVAPPDLRYSARDLGTYDDDVKAVDPLASGSTPGRAYKPYSTLPSFSTDKTCVRLRAISGGAAGYKPLVMNDAVRASAGAWKKRLRDGANDFEFSEDNANTADEIYKVQFKAGNSLDPITGLNSPWWFAPPIWIQLDANFCADGSISGAGQGGRIAYNSWMPHLYLYKNLTQTLDLKGVPVTTGAVEAAPAQQGDVYHISQPPSGYPGGIFTEDTAMNKYGMARPLNPWDACDFTQWNGDHAQGLRNGSPWKLSFYANTDDTPDEVRLCDDSPGTYQKGNHDNS